jgi:DNA topoisomerase IB
MVAISGSLIEGYNQLSSSFTIDQKRIADSINFAPMLEQLKRTAESNEKILELQKEAIKQAIENERRQRKLTYITTAIAVIAIIIAIIAWLFPR